jgi:hypothetical protein
MIRTLALALVFGTTVLFGSLYAYATDHDESTGNGIDLSGVGRCSGRTLNVTSAWSWTQYPSRPSVTEVTEVPDGFVGKNAIVWTGDGAFDEFVVQSIDDRVVSADRALEVNGSCHFTLDKASCTETVVYYEDKLNIYDSKTGVVVSELTIKRFRPNFPYGFWVGNYYSGSQIKSVSKHRSAPRQLKFEMIDGTCFIVKCAKYASGINPTSHMGFDSESQQLTCSIHEIMDKNIFWNHVKNLNWSPAPPPSHPSSPPLPQRVLCYDVCPSMKKWYLSENCWYNNKWSICSGIFESNTCGNTCVLNERCIEVKSGSYSCIKPQ